jgi:membrane protease YdiL (CAAX protease family)
LAWSFWGRLQVFIFGVVLAPIIEETMFRGVLYRHLRELSRGLRMAISILFSATVASFVFAVIHPQGWLGVPLLMAVAYMLTLAREWRGTLIPGIVAHAITNAVSMSVILLLAMGT